MIDLVKRIIRKLLCSFAVFLLCTMFLHALQITAHAEILVNATAEIKLTTEVLGADEPSEVFTFVLEAADEGAPMPDITELTITGADAASFFITYDQVGEYAYRLYEKPGTADRWTYDDAVYTVKVYVLWDENTNELEAYTIYYDKEGYKTEAVFINTYEPEIVPSVPEPDTPQTGDISNIRLFTITGLLSLFLLHCLLKKRKGKHRKL